MKNYIFRKIGILSLAFFFLHVNFTLGYIGELPSGNSFIVEMDNTNSPDCQITMVSIVGTCPNENQGEIHFNVDTYNTTTGTCSMITLLVNGNSTSSPLQQTGSSSFAFQNLAHGSGYSIIVANMDGSCSTSQDNISIPSIGMSISANILATPSSILNCVTSSINLSVEDIPNATYTWMNLGTNMIIGDSQNINVDVAGDYSITIVNDSGCEKSDTITIVDYSNSFPVANAGNDQELTSCVNGVMLNGSGSMPSTAPNAGLNYSWSGPNGFSSSALKPEVNEPGTYTLIVTDTISQCTATNQVNVTTNIVFPIADAGEDGILTCIVNEYQLGGPGTSTGQNFTYLWSVLLSTNPNITISNPGTYTLTVTDTTSQCSVSDEVIVVQDITPPIIEIDTSGIIQLCNGDGIQINAISSNADIFNWQPNGEMGSNITLTEVGAYFVIGTNSTNGCTATSSSVEIQILPTPTLTIDSNEIDIKNGEDYSFSAEFEPSNSSIFWKINMNDFPNIDTSASQLSTQGSGIPMGKLFTENERFFGKVIFNIYPELDGCQGEIVIGSVSVLPEEEIFIPDVFTPNGDMVNDTWEIIFDESEKANDYSITIYTRSGAKVYEMNSLAGNDWTGDGCPDGVYFYYLKNKEGSDERKGAVTILRNGN